MGLLLSCSHLHAENNSPQFAFYTDRFRKLACPGSWIFDFYVFVNVICFCRYLWSTPLVLPLVQYKVYRVAILLISSS